MCVSQFYKIDYSEKNLVLKENDLLCLSLILLSLFTDEPHTHNFKMFLKAKHIQMYRRVKFVTSSL